MYSGSNRPRSGHHRGPTRPLVVAAALVLLAAAPTRLFAASLSLSPPLNSGTAFSLWSPTIWTSAGGNAAPAPGDDLTLAASAPAQILLYLGSTIDEPAQDSSVSTLSVLGSQAVTIDGAGDVPGFSIGSLYLTQGNELACRLQGTGCALLVDIDPGTRFELRDAAMLLSGNAEVIRGTLAITQTVDSTILFGTLFASPFVQLGGPPALGGPSQATLEISGFGSTPRAFATARIFSLNIRDIDATALRISNGAWLDVYNLFVDSVQTPSFLVPATTRIEIGDTLSEIAKLSVESTEVSGRSGRILLDSVGREIEMVVAERGEVELTGFSSSTVRSNIALRTRAGADPGSVLLDIDGGLVDVTTPTPPVITSTARYDLSVSAREGGTATLRVQRGGELRGSHTAIQRSIIGSPTFPPGIASLEVATGGLIANGHLYLAGATLAVQDGTLLNEGLSLSDPLAQLSQEPAEATLTSAASRLESGGRIVGVYSGSTLRFESGAVGTEASTTTVGGSASGITTGLATSRLELTGPGTSFDSGNLSIGLPTYSALYSGTRSCPAPFGNGSGVVEITNGAILRVGNAQNVASDPFGIRPTLALAPAHDAYAASELRLDATSSVVVASTGSTIPQPGSLVVGLDGQLAGSGFINGSAPGQSPDLVLRTGGLIAPGCALGMLSVAGSYSQQAGELEIEIAGPNPGQFDVLDAAGGATLVGGTIRFERINGYLGDVGAQLSLFAGRAVAVDPSVVLIDNTDLGLDFDRSTGIATITRTVPEPAAAAMLASGCIALAALKRRGSGVVRKPSSRLRR